MKKNKSLLDIEVWMQDFLSQDPSTYQAFCKAMAEYDESNNESETFQKVNKILSKNMEIARRANEFLIDGAQFATGLSKNEIIQKLNKLLTSVNPQFIS